VQQRVVQGRLRPTVGSPPWLPPGETAELVAAERKAYRTDEEGRVLVETGLFETGTGFLFRCPICGNEARNDQRLEPMCTGPSWTNDHPPEIMFEVRR
jgi:hypothetical protein